MERTKCEFALGGFEGGAERPVSGVSFRPKVPEPDWQAPLYAGWHRRVERPPPEGGGQCVGARRTPRYPWSGATWPGGGRWNRSVNFDLVHSFRGPGKVLLPHHCHRMMSL